MSYTFYDSTFIREVNLNIIKREGEAQNVSLGLWPSLVLEDWWWPSKESLNDIHEVINFWSARRGMGGSFHLKIVTNSVACIKFVNFSVHIVNVFHYLS